MQTTWRWWGEVFVKLFSVPLGVQKLGMYDKRIKSVLNQNSLVVSLCLEISFDSQTCLLVSPLNPACSQHNTYMDEVQPYRVAALLGFILLHVLQEPQKRG